MPRHIPTLVAGAVGALIALAVVHLTARTPSITHSAVATAAAPAEDVGPAATVILAGDPEVRLTARDGHLAWGTEAGSRALAIGVVNTGKVLAVLLKRERYEEERQAFRAELEKAGQDFDTRARDLQAKYQGIKPDSPEAGEARAAMQQLQQDYQEFVAKTTVAEGTLAADQYTTAYGELRTAVDVIADQRKIDLVYRFIPPDEKIAPADQDTLTLQMQARTFLRLPDGIDLTADVMKELNLTEE